MFILRRADWVGLVTNLLLFEEEEEEEVSRLEKRERTKSEQNNEEEHQCIKIVRRNKINVLIMLACV